MNVSFVFRSDPWISQETLAVYEDRHTSRPNPETAGGVRGCKWRSHRRFEQQTVVTASGWAKSEQREIRAVPRPQEPSKELQTMNTKLYKMNLLPEIRRYMRLWVLNKTLTKVLTLQCLLRLWYFLIISWEVVLENYCHLTEVTSTIRITGLCHKSSRSRNGYNCWSSYCYYYYRWCSCPWAPRGSSSRCL